MVNKSMNYENLSKLMRGEAVEVLNKKGTIQLDLKSKTFIVMVYLLDRIDGCPLLQVNHNVVTLEGAIQELDDYNQLILYPRE